MNLDIKWLVVALLLVCAVSAEPFTATDMHSLKRLGEFAVNSENQVAYSVSHWDQSTSKTTSSLFLEGGSPLTVPGQAKDFSPAFSPADSDTLFFLSSRGGPINVFTQSISNSRMELTQVTQYPISISNLRVATNYLLFSAEIYTDCGIDFQCTADKDNQLESDPNHGTVYDSLFVRHWDEYIIPGKTSQLFVQPITKTVNGYTAVGFPIWITKAMPPSNTPVPPDGGKEMFDISPDESAVAFTVAMINHRSAWNTGWLIFQVILDPRSGQVVKNPVCVTCNATGPRTTQPQYDPSGKYIAYLSMDRPGFEADRLHLNLFTIATSTHTPLTANWDRSITEFSWTADGKSLLVAADDDGKHKVFAVSLTGSNSPFPLLTNGTNSGITVSSQNRVIFTSQAYDAPSDLKSFVWNPSAAPSVPSVSSITRLNPDLNQYGFDAGTSFYFNSEDGSKVQGWFLRPAGWKPGVKYPFILLIHGGPQGAWNSAWSYRWNPQLWAQQGYAVALINPHGSTGFGQAFCDAVSGNWGGIPYRDLMTGVDQILSTYSWIDKQRTVAAGASYGGYMINWINGNTNRFKALLVHDGIFDVPASYGSTDELWFAEWEFQGTPWEKPENYQKWNPANLAQKWQTPTLVVHGGKDYRLPTSQGLMAFTALQRQGIPSKYLFFPLENHWVTKPANSILWYKEAIAWMDTFAKNE